VSLEGLIEDAGQECSVQAQVLTSLPQTTMGGVNRTALQWSDVASGVPCLVRTTGSSLSLTSSDQRSNQEFAKIYFAQDPVPGGVSISHRIVVTNNGRGSAGLKGIYSIIGVIDPNGQGRLIQVSCQRLRSA
jgi:hypothetical protein